MPQYMSQAVHTFQPDNLIAGCTQIVSHNGTLAQGQNLPRGAMVGKITATGKLTLSVQAATDGSQVPYGVLLDDYDATAADVVCGIYVKAELNPLAMTFGAGWNAQNAYDPLRNLGIYIKPVVAQSGRDVG